MTGKGKNGGPTLLVSTLASPYFAITLDVAFLGLHGVDIASEISNSGMQFSLSGQAYAFLDATIACQLSGPTQFSCSSGLSVTVVLDIGPLTLPGSSYSLGTLHLSEGFGGSLSVSLNGDVFSATITGKIHFMAHRYWDIPPLHLQETPADMAGFVQSLLASIQAEGNQIFAGLTADPKQWASQVTLGMISGVTDIASAFKNAYNLTAHQAAVILKSLNEDATKVSQALLNIYGESLDGAAQALAGAGYTAIEAIYGLKAIYNATADQVASALKGAGYAAYQVAELLRTIYGLPVDQGISILKWAGYSVDQIAERLTNGYGLPADQVASALKNVGYGADQIASVLKNNFGWSADQVVNLLKDSFGMDGDAVNSALNGAGYTADQVGGALQSAFGSGSPLNPSNW